MERAAKSANVKTVPQHGKRQNQKLKPYAVMQYLLRYSDENNPATAFDIIDYLADCGIEAERRSIYRDIEDINKVYLMIEEECTIDEAAEMLEEDETLKLVVYDSHKKGFYIRQRHFDLNDIRILAECVYSAKFIPQSQADRLADVVCGFVSEYQADKIKHDSLVIGRVKTLNHGVLNNIGLLRDAMAAELDGEPHTPEKVSFNYLTHEITDIEKPVERRRKYVVSPFYLIINDGNYYLLAFDDQKQDMRTFRVDRMKNLSFTQQPRDGEEAFKKLDMKTYTQRVFSMFGGEKKYIRMRFINPLLDTVIDRFGTKGVSYTKADDSHFRISANIEISDQFYSWVCGFGKKVMIETPDVAAGFAAYLDKIREMYYYQ